MKVIIIASGSKGNCVYLEHKNHKILLDLGVTFKQINLRLKQVGIDVFDVNKVLLTHEHSDHTIGLKTFSNNISPIYYLSKGTFDSLKPILKENLEQKEYKIVNKFDLIEFDDLKITVIPAHHDSKENIGFMFELNDKKMVYMTDTGYIDEALFPMLCNADTYILESNYDTEILYTSERMYHLKKRVASDVGHMSNYDCAVTLTNLIGEKTKRIVYAHISLECNNHEVIWETHKKIYDEKNIDYKDIEFIYAKQYEITDGFEI